MLAFSVREALRQAAAAFGPAGTSVDLASPATPEAVWWALTEARRARRGPPVEGKPGVAPDAADPTRPAPPESEVAHAAPVPTRTAWSGWRVEPLRSRREPGCW
jgi:xanthine dehydrogenase large subunit